MRSIFQIIQDVLSDIPDIDELPQEKLWALQPKKGAVLGEFEVEPDIFIRAARLQTLYLNAQKQSEIPGHEDFISQKEVTGQSHAAALSNSMALSRDSVYQVIMLKRMIVELVRSEVSREQEHFDSEYIAGPDGKIYRIPATEYVRPLLD